MSEDKIDIIHRGNYLSFVKNQTRGWEYVSRDGIPGAVAIAAFTNAGEMILIEQFRVPVQKYVIELPAGLVGDEEDQNQFKTGDASLATAKNELFEETGFESLAWSFGATGTSSAGLTDESIDIWLAQDCQKAGLGGGIGGEDIKVHLVPVQDVFPFLTSKRASGLMIDLKIYAAIGLCLQKQQ